MRENMNCTLRVRVDFSPFVGYSVCYTPTGGVRIVIYTLTVIRMLYVGAELAQPPSAVISPRRDIGLGASESMQAWTL
ncbi:hypothetical protein KSD_29480 [Ktedonobacter sp. SOSP1-85]|nr:hypothetical protein KSD_29480 [Ktedonobacter sp. SOSP1-85]